MSEKRYKRYLKRKRRDSIRATKPVWFSILGGPSYTPETSLGIGAATLLSIRMSKTDTVSQRSFIPFGFAASLNGTFQVAGIAAFFFNQNKFRVYASYAYRIQPSHYFGKGFEAGETQVQSSTTTAFKKSGFQFYPRVVWEVAPSLYIGPLMDLTYTKNTDFAEPLQNDPYLLELQGKGMDYSRYLNIGFGGQIQYDTRDDVATPHRGYLLSLLGKGFGHALGSDYKFGLFDLEYRHFIPMFKRRSTLGWVVRSQQAVGTVPFTDLPTFGSPFDLRGYFQGQYRDLSMTYAIAEYRHMFGSQALYDRGSFWAKLGFVAWGGAGSVAPSVVEQKNWKFNYGVGLRIEIQPNKNFRADFGREVGGKGIMFYMNMTEAF